MYQPINQRVAVAGVFDKGRFKPWSFKWQDKKFLIEQVTMVTDSRNGGVKKRHYSIQSGPNLYRLLFNRETEQWWLEEVWYESGA